MAVEISARRIAGYFPSAKRIHESTINKREILQTSEYIIVTSRGRKPLEVCDDAFNTRLKELTGNKPAIDELIDLAEGIETSIIVVTNPVDFFARYIQERLPRTRVRAFGLSLDKHRYSKYFDREIEVVGLHGNAVPLLGLDDETKYREIMRTVNQQSLREFQAQGIDYTLCSKLFFEYFNGFWEQDADINMNATEHKILDSIMSDFELAFNFYFKNKDGEVR